LAIGTLSLLAAGTALAQGGTTTSAGDQQYVDPLTNTATTPAPATSAPAPSAPAPSASSSAPTSAPPASATAAPSSAPSAPVTPTSSGGGSGTLPYTGVNVGLIVAIGLGLLLAGLILRRLARRV
jgi:LPXTG-motif cell wall-anchored protein